MESYRLNVKNLPSHPLGFRDATMDGRNPSRDMPPVSGSRQRLYWDPSMGRGTRRYQVFIMKDDRPYISASLPLTMDELFGWLEVSGLYVDSFRQES